jgi:thiol:disulfide interchange protein
VGNAAAKNFSISFFISAALLALFGVSAMNTSQGNGMAQLVLGVVMLGAGLYLLSGTAEARLVALGAAAITIAFGAFELTTGRGYVPGTIVAIFVFARLSGAGAAFGPTTANHHPQQAYPQAYPQPQANAQPYPQAYPQQPYGAPTGYAAPAVPPPTAPAPDARFG